MLTRLKSLVAISESGNISAAAKRLYISQPAVTQHVRFLEEYFKRRLLRRCGNRMTLTPEGEILCNEARKALANIESLENVFQTSNSSTKRICFSTIESVTASILPSAIKVMLQRYSGIILEPRVYASTLAHTKLLEGEIDIALCNLDGVPEGLAGETLFTEKLVFVSSNFHPRLKTLKTLKNEKFILFPRESLTRGLIDKVFERLKIVPEIVLENIKASTVTAFVEGGVGLSILPYFSIYKEVMAKRVVVLPIETNVKRKVGIAYKRGKALTSDIIAFIDCLRKEAAKIRDLKGNKQNNGVTH